MRPVIFLRMEQKDICRLHSLPLAQRAGENLPCPIMGGNFIRQIHIYNDSKPFLRIDRLQIADRGYGMAFRKRNTFRLA